ncbi:hypothetical protein QBC34DRAFT_395136 [Podospora aff. communis PSN243]|uniref:Uncharacterized protein n=1 Tax=Podospora aff. communis PSN243 TaxID=3040156 RepID=A0AAV9H151_9PEZI|nr:hypothetical protein QBC34DRAFT_395136 [Podospora aff. communis PSN243]
MSSRLTAPVSKLTRSISTTPSVARPSHLLNSVSKAAAAGRKRNQSAHDSPETPETTITRSHSTSTPHRPTTSAPRIVPLMQGFRTSAPKPQAPRTTTLDFAVLPDLHEAAPDPYAYIRVPLLPDNDAPPAGFRRPEAQDLPLAKPEISVVAANPELVLPAALTEVEGMGVDGVELSFAHELHRDSEVENGHGMLKDIWKGLVDDVLGEKKPAF